MMFRARYGFTIVELLVVVTIIVILLAMLSPALSKALYQAQLTQCAANQKIIASGMTFYAYDHQRRYPFRDLPTEPAKPDQTIQAHKLTHPLESGSGVGNYDLRPMFKPYISVNKSLNDPLTAPVDLEKDDATGGSARTTNVYASMFLWSGWQYTGPGGGSRMAKIGDRFTYPVNANKTLSFNLLVGDIDCRAGSAYASHSDFNHLTNSTLQDVPNPFGGPMTASQWYRRDSALRDPLDLNYAYADGSVRRVTKVEFFWERPDERMTFIPNYNYIGGVGGSPGGQNHVPIN